MSTNSLLTGQIVLIDWVRHSTGITGYIAGDAFVTLHERHPDYEYTALVRTEEKAKQVTTKYRKVKTVIGDLDNYNLIKEYAASNDIILREFTIVNYSRLLE